MLTFEELTSEVEAGIDRHGHRRARRHARPPRRQADDGPLLPRSRRARDRRVQLAPDARYGVRRDAGLRHLEPRPRLRGLPAAPGSRYSAAHSLARGDGARALRSQLVRRHARRAVAAVHPGAAGRAGSRGRLRAPHQLGARVLPLPRELRRGACERVHEAEPVLPVRDRRAPARPRLRRAVHPPATRGDGGRRRSDRDVQGGGVARPARDHVPLRRPGDLGRPSRHLQARGEGDRRAERLLGDVHGQAGSSLVRKLVPHPHEPLAGRPERVRGGVRALPALPRRTARRHQGARACSWHRT